MLQFNSYDFLSEAARIAVCMTLGTSGCSKNWAAEEWRLFTARSKKGRATATSKMVYKHFWYAFEAHPPFAVLGASLPFTLPGGTLYDVVNAEDHLSRLSRRHEHL